MATRLASPLLFLAQKVNQTYFLELRNSSRIYYEPSFFS